MIAAAGCAWPAGPARPGRCRCREIGWNGPVIAAGAAARPRRATTGRPRGMLVVAHVSDVHIDGSEDRDRRLRAVMGYLASLRRPVDVVLVTGDIADHGLAAEYERACGL